MTVDFEKYLNYGRIGENEVSQYLMLCGWTVFPVCNTPVTLYKGPRLNRDKQEIIAPDILAFTNNQSVWFEVKTKNAATLYRKENRYGKRMQWQTGIDVNVYHHYCEVAKATPLPVRLLFLHKPGVDKFNGSPSPTGLYAADIDFLKNTIDHMHKDYNSYGKGGMVYWNISDLELIAPLEAVLEKKQYTFDCFLT